MLLSLSVVHMHLTLLRIFVGAARIAVGYVLLQMLDWQLVVDSKAKRAKDVRVYARQAPVLLPSVSHGVPQR